MKELLGLERNYRQGVTRRARVLVLSMDVYSLLSDRSGLGRIGAGKQDGDQFAVKRGIGRE